MINKNLRLGSYMKSSFVMLLFVILIGGCVSNSVNYKNDVAKPTIYTSPNEMQGKTAGIGIESQDIVSVTDKMMRDMMSNHLLTNSPTPPRVIIDSKYFSNESSSRMINKNLFTDRLRVQLTRASNGRMVFVGREHIAMVEKERELKRAGVTDGGTIRTTKATAGADYRLVGRITSLDSVKVATAETSRYHQIIFEMIDMELGTIIWNGLYEFQKTAQDDVIYH
jgi:PBP1b-binding outer membrane lipoprotein LpoB